QRISSTTPDDWSAVTYPERHELTALRSEAAEIDAVRRKLREATETANKARTVRAKLDSARDRHAKVRQGLPSADPAALRQEHAAKQAEETAVVNAVKATKKEIVQTETEVERQQRQLGEIDRELTEITGKFHTEEVS